MTAKQLEETLVAAGATVTHPVKHDPAVYKDGAFIGFFTE